MPKLLRFKTPLVLNLLCLLFLAVLPQVIQAGLAPSGRVYFTPNRGQWADSILFRGQAPGGTLWFTRNRVYYHFTRELDTTRSFSSKPQERLSPERMFARPQTRVEHLLLSTELAGSSKEIITVSGEGEPQSRSNYFLGNDPTRWQTNLPDYPSIVYHDVYPGIDLRYRNTGGRLEYDFIVAPGTDPSTIQMRLSGSQSLQSGSNGQLVLQTGWGSVKQEAPRVYQVSGSDTTWLRARFVQTADQTFGFDYDRSENPNLAVVIDPALQLCTYWGGNGDDVGTDPGGTRPSIYVDKDGNVIMTGYTKSSDFPVFNAMDGSLGGTRDVFVTKKGPGGNTVFSTYLGGGGDDFSFAEATDNQDSIYVAGTTFSSDFPTLNGAMSSPAGQGDAFLIRLNANGVLSYGTYYGGSLGTEWASSIWVSHDGTWVWLSGDIYSPGGGNLPTTGNPLQPAWGGGNTDCFLLRFDPTQSGPASLQYASFIGGTSDDGSALVDLTADGQVCVTGFTNSPNFLGLSGSTSASSIDVFFARLSHDGSSLLNVEYLGGTGTEQPLAIAVDVKAGTVYLTGITNSDGFATLGGVDNIRNGTDGFVTRLRIDGTDSITTYLGGGGTDEGRYLEIDPHGQVIVTGNTDGPGFPQVLNAGIQTNLAGAVDAFLTVLKPDLSAILFSTYIGGSGNDWARGLARNPAGDMLIMGYTESSNLAVTGNAWDNLNHGAGDAFVVQIENIDYDYDGILNDVDACPQDSYNDFDGDGLCADADNCPFVSNVGQLDINPADGVGDVCEGADAHFDVYPTAPQAGRVVSGGQGELAAGVENTVYSPVSMVVTAPNGDSIGRGFNTIGMGATYDSTQDISSPSLGGPDGNLDDRVTVPVAVSGPYTVRLVHEPKAGDNTQFTLSIRIDGNQQLVPEGYSNASVSSLGGSLPETYVWVASTILTGDFNGDGNCTSSDIILLVNQAFKSGPPPNPATVSDVNCSGTVTSADIIVLVNFVFKGGLSPCSNSAG